jgi:hypothetical protein
MSDDRFPMLVRFHTEDGDGEALKTSRDEPWEISYPWGARRFFGSQPELKAVIKRDLATRDAEEPEL